MYIDIDSIDVRSCCQCGGCILHPHAITILGLRPAASGQKQPAQIRQVKTSEPSYVEINRKDLGRTFGWNPGRTCVWILSTELMGIHTTYFEIIRNLRTILSKSINIEIIRNHGRTCWWNRGRTFAWIKSNEPTGFCFCSLKSVGSR